ncbi:hypothetical protein SRHO_G00314880 [Serrasalmus rhombeus]
MNTRKETTITFRFQIVADRHWTRLSSVIRSHGHWRWTGLYCGSHGPYSFQLITEEEGGSLLCQPARMSNIDLDLSLN